MPRIGKYTLEKILGKGAMGEVWLSSHPEKKTPLAIKVLKFTENENSFSNEIIARFLREAEISSSLNHPNIVQVYEVNMYKGKYFIVMEYVKGSNLRELLNADEEAFDENQLIDISLDVINGLNAALEKKIIHRDIKPDNIMMDEDGNIKLTDMGIAKQLDSLESLTPTGYAIGTPEYISPEQAMGKKNIDHRADIYSLGATLYHLSTGEPPYSGTVAIDVMMKHAQEPLTHPKLRKPDLSEGLSAVIYKMMEKNPKNRYQTYAQLRSDLEAVKRGASMKKLQARIAFDSLIRPRRRIPDKKCDQTNIYVKAAALIAISFIIYKLCAGIF